VTDPASPSPIVAGNTDAPASPALAVALARIDREFGIAAFHRSRKRRVRRLLRAGTADLEVRLRYGWLAEEARDRGLDLVGALVVLERCRQANARHDRAVRLYASSFRLLNRETIFALRLVLRVLRRRTPASFRDVIDAMSTAHWRDAAE
jgi:hypothetical protein